MFSSASDSNEPLLPDPAHVVAGVALALVEDPEVDAGAR